MTIDSQATRRYKVVGTSPVRHDGVDKVTGTALYGADLRLPAMLFGQVLRSPHAHARIKSIDVSKAEAHPHVKAVATSNDIHPSAPVSKDVIIGQVPPENIFARKKVFYRGHPVAAVAATSLHDAEQALSLIHVDYEPLPAVTNGEDAMVSGAPILHEHWTDDEGRGTNVAAHDEHRFGDIEEGFRDADVVMEREFRTKTVHQGYIEPQNATAMWTHDGCLTVWCSSQGHFGVRDNTARILGMSVSNVKIVPMEIGGGFGGKLPVYLEPVAAVLAKKSARPVKMAMSRAEVLEATGPTCGSYIRIKMGATEEGRIIAAQAYFVFEAGAFPGAPLIQGAASVFAPYYLENVVVEGYDVVDNKPKTTAYRAPGAPIVAYAAESLMDELAERLRIDPVEFRLLNVAVEGTRRADGVMNGCIGAKEVMEAVKAHPHYTSPRPGKYQGRGVAMGFCRNNTGMASAVANVLPNGAVSLVEGNPDIGGTRTSLSQQLAEVLGIPVQDVKPMVADTDTIGYTSLTAGSSVTFKSGWAVYEAGQDVIRQLVQRASTVWDVPKEEIGYVDGVLRHKLDPELTMTFKEMSALLLDTGGPVVGRASLNPGGSGASYSANIVDVEVDPETGKVQVVRYTAFQDAGTAVHPAYVEGQIQGGASQGVGWALSEEYLMGEDGRMLNSTFLDYRMPTSLDLPMIEPVIVEVPHPGHPFGVRGVGEANLSPTLAAIANAVHKATGARMRELPMKPQVVLAAMRAKIE